MSIIRKAMLATAALAVALTSGCQVHKTATNADLTNVKFQNPDRIRVVQNIDGHPNIAEVCFDGVAFATTTRDAAGAFLRVPEWDRLCPGYVTK